MTTIQEIRSQTERKMTRSLEGLREEFRKNRTGRASTGLLDSIFVEYYGARTPLAQCAAVTSGQTLRVPLPPLTEERRREITKVVKRLAEEGKVAIRNVRREANDAVKKLLKDKEISEDEARGSDNDIQTLTDKFLAEVDTVTDETDKEIRPV